MAENGRTAGRTTTRRAWAGTMAGFDDLMVPIRPQAPNAVKRGDGQPEDGREWREPMASVVDQPIINSPLEEPARRHRIRDATAELVDVRRICHRVLDSWRTLVQNPVTHPAVPPVGFSAASSHFR